MSKNIVTAADVRAYFNADPKRLAALSDKARHTVEFKDGKAPRGRLHPEAVKVHNKRRKVQYVTGSSRQAAVVARAEMDNLRVQAADAGLAVGTRGPLSKEARQTLGLDKPKSRTRKGK